MIATMSELDDAWSACLAALPAGWRFSWLAQAMYDGDNEPARVQWFAAATPTPFRDSLGPYFQNDDDEMEGRGDTPVGALRALAARMSPIASRDTPR